MSAHLCVSLAVTLTIQDSLDSTCKGVMWGPGKKLSPAKYPHPPITHLHDRSAMQER